MYLSQASTYKGEVSSADEEAVNCEFGGVHGLVLEKLLVSVNV